MRTVLVVALAACGGASSTGVVANTASPVETLPGTRPFPAFARADLVVAAQTGELVAYTLADSSVSEIGRVRLVDEMAENYTFGEPLVFLDRDHLVVRGGSETEYWIVTPAGAAPLTVPGDDLFRGIPKPTRSDHGLELEPGFGGTAVPHGAALYWEHCAWGYSADGFQCDASGFIRMWPLDPSHQLLTRLPPAVTATSPSWTDAKPGFVTGTNEDSQATCQPTKGDPIILVPATEYGSLGGVTQWIADGVALIEFGDYGLADFLPSSFSVYASCGADPLFSGLQYTLFHGGLWVADEITSAGERDDLVTVSRLRRGLQVVADLPENRGVVLRPAR